ncbi:MAG: hypothetical protein WAN66_11515 [Limnoraphis robusta]
MSSPSKLNEVVEHLEKDVNLNRIKKVMLCACRGQWENNQDLLIKISTRNLVQELYWKTQTLENLYNILDRILSKINKKSQYTLIIHTIINQVGQLYLEDQLNPSHFQADQNLSESTLTQNSQAVETTQPNQKLNSLSSIPNLFDVRWRIMQYTNPLRVKLLLFSTLEREFNFSTQEWSQLKLHSLDDLLRHLLQNFPMISGLRSHLLKMADYLENPDENAQAVSVLLDALKPIYAINTEKSSNTLEEKLEVNTCYVNDKIEEDFLSIEEKTSENVNSFLLNQEPKLAENPLTSETLLTPDHSMSTRLRTEELENLNNQLESQVQIILNHSIRKTIYPINQTWDELQNLLDLCLKNQTSEERFQFKKQALQKLIDTIEIKVYELKKDLNELETSEIKLAQTIDPSQQKMMELARQGNPKAIASLINQSLQTRGIHTQVKSQAGCLHIVVAAEEIPSPEPTASFVHKKLIFLKITSIHHIKIYGRKIGQKSVAWTQQYAYNSLKG